MATDRITRRDFVETVGMTAGASALLGATGTSSAAAANEKIRLGLIGAGSRGGQLLDSFLPQKDVEIIAISDVDDHHAGESAERVKKAKGNLPVTARDYRAMLERKDLDAVIIATPDHWHAIPAIHAVLAGKDVYVEKPVAHNIAEGRAMIKAARKTNKIMAVGTQQAALLPIFKRQYRDRAFQENSEGLLGADLESPRISAQWAWVGILIARPHRTSITIAGSAPPPSTLLIPTDFTSCSAGTSTTPAA